MTSASPRPSDLRPPQGYPLALATGSSRLRIQPFTLQVGIVLGGAAVIALWWKDTGAIHGVGDTLTNAGRIIGLLAGYLIVVLLALMARVPAVEHGVGADRLVRWHSMLGRYTVCLIVAHALLITWGYALTDHKNVFGETVSLWTTYADVLMATVALVLFVGVGISSMRLVRRKLRYETWHYIHFYTYLAIALAFSHQFATGAEFSTSLPARFLWGTFYVIVTGLLVWYRFLTPVVQSLQHGLHVEQVVHETDDTTSVWIAGKNLQELMVESGQFFRWRFMNRSLWWAANPYSLSAAPHATLLRITVKEAGDHSSALRNLRPGTRVIAEGPYGAMTAAVRTRKSVLLIAGGVGITPIRALFESLHGQPGDIALLYRASHPQDVLFREELDQLASQRGARLIYSVGPRNSKHDVIRPGHLQKAVPDVAQRDVYLCGPAGLMNTARTVLKAAGVPNRHIHVEDFEF